MKRATQSRSRAKKHLAVSSSAKMREIMVIAEKEGLLHWERTQVVRGRMPQALVLIPMRIELWL